jgi:hypothetical protein
LEGAYCASAHGILTEIIIQQALLLCQEKNGEKMIYSVTTPIEDLPCYLPEIGGYFMSKSEQDERRDALRSQEKQIMREMAGIETDMKAAGPRFNSLGRSLTECQVGNLDWSVYKTLILELPTKARRFDALKIELQDVRAQLAKFID